MSDKLEVADEIKRGLISRKIQLWRNTIYDAILDARVADLLGNKAKKAEARNRIKNAVRVIKLLQKFLDEVNNGSE